MCGRKGVHQVVDTAIADQAAYGLAAFASAEDIGSCDVFFEDMCWSTGHDSSVFNRCLGAMNVDYNIG